MLYLLTGIHIQQAKREVGVLNVNIKPTPLKKTTRSELALILITPRQRSVFFAHGIPEVAISKGTFYHRRTAAIRMSTYIRQDVWSSSFQVWIWLLV